jgi:hypothetical protein
MFRAGDVKLPLVDRDEPRDLVGLETEGGGRALAGEGGQRVSGRRPYSGGCITGARVILKDDIT